MLRLLDPQLEHAETCSTAEATRKHHAYVHAVVCGMKLGRPLASQLRNPGRLMFSLPLAAARGDAAQAFIRKLSHYRNETRELRQQNIHCRPQVWTADWRPHPAVTRTLRERSRHRFHSKRATFVGEIPSSQVETRNPNRSPAPGGQPWLAQFSRIILRGQSGSSQVSSTELCTTGDMSPLLTVTLILTQQYLTMTDDTVLSPQRVARVGLCFHQVSSCPVHPVRGGVRLLADDGAPTERAGPTAPQVSTPLRLAGQQVLDILALEDDVFQRCLSAQPDPTALKRSNRCKCAYLLRDLADTADLPPHCALFSQQLLDLTHRWWSETEGPDIEEVMSMPWQQWFTLHSARYPDPAPFQLPDTRQRAAPSLTFSRLLPPFRAGANLTTRRLCIRLRLCMKL